MQAHGLRGGQREQALVGDGLGTLHEGAAGHDGEVVAQPSRAIRHAARATRLVALLHLGVIAHAHGDGVDVRVEAGLAERDEVGSGPKTARRCASPRR